MRTSRPPASCRNSSTDAGHFALETHAEEIGQLVLDFLARLNPRDGYAARRVGERLSLQCASVPNSG
jgi:hypothetical protein